MFRNASRAGASVLLAFAAWSAAPAAAEPTLADCAAAAGSYVTRNSLPDGKGGTLVSRSLLTLTTDGIALRSDSDQDAGEDAIAFGDSYGSWRCAGREGGRLLFTATLLDFTFPGPGQGQRTFGRIDYRGSVDPESGSLEIEALLTFVPLDQDPLAPPAEGTGIPVAITGARIEAPPAR